MTHMVAQFGDEIVVGWEQAASGYAAVWATDNTREALFDAMQRKETYATTAPGFQLGFSEDGTILWMIFKAPTMYQLVTVREYLWAVIFQKPQGEKPLLF